MAPDLKAQSERAQRRADETLQLQRQRRVAGSMLVGMALGAALCVPLDIRFAEAILWGGMLSAGVTWIVNGLLAERRRKIH